MSLKRKSVSVVLLCHNQASNLRHIIRSMYQQTLRPCEVIIADDNSNQPIENIARRYGCKYVRTHSERRSPHFSMRSLARQLGTLSANGDILLFLDGDIIPPRKMVEALYFYHSLHSNSVVKVPRRFRITIDRRLLTTNDLPNTQSAINCRLSFGQFTSDCFGVDKSTLMDVGGWDTSFVGWGEEDIELAYRFHLAGTSIISPHHSELYCTHIDHPVDHQNNFLSLQRNARHFMQKFKEIRIIRSHVWKSLNVYCSSYYQNYWPSIDNSLSSINRNRGADTTNLALDQLRLTRACSGGRVRESHIVL